MKEVLIIDDEPDIGLLLSAVLKSLGYEPHYANSFTKGVEQYKAIEPKVVFLDLSMPDGSGFDLVPIIRKENPDTKIIIISAHDGSAEREQAKKIGVDHFMAKPFNKQHIQTALDKVAAAS